MTKHYITVKKGETALVPNLGTKGPIKLPEGIWLIIKDGEIVTEIRREL